MRLVDGLVVLAASALACGKESGPSVTVENTLVFTRADSSVVTFANQVLVWCGPWEQGLIPVQSLHIVVGGTSGAPARWELRAVLADVVLGQPNLFPNVFVFDQPGNVDLFVYDPPNELSTQNGRSSGLVTFQTLVCGRTGAVDFSIDAVIGSEFANGPSLTVRGSFRAPVGDAPF